MRLTAHAAGPSSPASPAFLEWEGNPSSAPHSPCLVTTPSRSLSRTSGAYLTQRAIAHSFAVDAFHRISDGSVAVLARNRTLLQGSVRTEPIPGSSPPRSAPPRTRRSRLTAMPRESSRGFGRARPRHDLPIGCVAVPGTRGRRRSAAADTLAPSWLDHRRHRRQPQARETVACARRCVPRDTHRPQISQSTAQLRLIPDRAQSLPGRRPGAVPGGGRTVGQRGRRSENSSLAWRRRMAITGSACVSRQRPP